RARSRSSAGELRLAVRGELSFRAKGEKRHVEVDEALTVLAGRQELLRDPEVRKNYTIAVLAEGMHEMAVLSTARRWAAADRALQNALRFSRAQFGSDDDVDVARVRAMAEAYSTTLSRYVDRFRDI